MSLAADVVAAMTAALEPHRDPERAAPMTAYMRHQFAFLGISTPERRRLVDAAWRDLSQPDEPTVHEVVLGCWGLAEREYQYCGVDYLAAHIEVCSPAVTLGVLERLITTRSWWDTVDGLARAGAGALVRRDPPSRAVMDGWLTSGQLWLIRSAILHQERWGAEMDFEWVSRACIAQAEHRDFFVRKAIGWVLRTYAHLGPAEADHVRALLEQAPFSGLTRREALRRVAH